MNQASKFSLILMHDDGRTHRMRVRRGLFRLLVALLVLSPLLGILGLWVGFEAWRTMSTWQQERISYQIKIDDMRVHLERLSTLEALLKREESARGQPGPTLAATTNPLAQNTASAPSSSTGASSPGTAPTTPPSTAPEPVASAQADAPLAAPGGEQAAASAESATSSNSTDNTEGDATPDEQRKAINTGRIRVENMQARLIDRRRLRASVDLYSADTKGRQLGGKTIFSLLTADGRQFPLSNEDATFRISRFKKVVTTSTLPVPASELENAAIVVEVNVDGKLVYRNLFSIETR